jgi:putative inorganic carbon (HCO3(-)) transporter
VTSWIARRLRFPETTPFTLQLTILFYLAHLLCEGWIGSSQGFLGLALLTGIIATIRGELRVRYHPLYLALLLFLVPSTISAAISSAPVPFIYRISEWFMFLGFPLALSLHRTIPRTIRLAFYCFLILALFQGLYGLAQYFLLGHTLLENRITGTTAHVMTYSGLLLPLSFMSAILAIERRHKLATSSAVVSMLALVLTFTRGAWLGWLAAATALMAVRRSRWIAYAIPILILAITFSPLPIFGRLISTFDTTQSSNLDRIRMVQAGIEIVKDHPFFGVGPANIKEIYPLYREPDAPRFRIPHLHNNLIQIWAERGILALSGYLLFVFAFITLCVRARREESSVRLFADIGIAVAVGLFFAGFFEFNFGDSEVLLVMIDVFALVCAGLEVVSNPLGNEAAVEAVLP